MLGHSLSVDVKNKDWHNVSWLHICQSKKLGKMQFFNPHENCSRSHSFENFQSIYVLNWDFEVYPKKAAIYTLGMYLYLLKAKALKIKKSKTAWFEHGEKIFELGSLSAISPALCKLKQVLLLTVKRLSISKCKRKKCTKIPDISFSPFCGFSLLVLPLLEADKKMGFMYYAEMSLRTSKDLMFSRPADRAQVFCSSTCCPLQALEGHVTFSFTNTPRVHCKAFQSHCLLRDEI